MIEEYEAKLLSVVGIASHFKMAHLPIAVCHHDSFKGCHGSLFIPLLYICPVGDHTSFSKIAWRESMATNLDKAGILASKFATGETH